MQRILLVAALLSLAGSARADWVELGAETYCSPDGTGFSLRSTALTGDDVSPDSDVHGYRALPLGVDQAIFCNVGSSRLDLVISRYPAQEKGQGQGSGVMVISRLAISGVEIFKDPVNFNWTVLDERVLTSISVKPAGGDVDVVLCSSNGFAWNVPYADERCEVKALKGQGIGRSGSFP